jgi:two-component sensor histidine kinase
MVLADSVDSNSIAGLNSPSNEVTELRNSLFNRGSTDLSDMGDWIWGEKTMDRQTSRFWKTFDIPDSTKVLRARLRLTGDNEYILYLDGRELGRDAEWRHIYEYDITALLSPGHHILAVEVYNSSREAGMTLGMLVCLSDGRILSIKSDKSWVVGTDFVPGWENVEDWQKMSSPPPSWPYATVIAPFNGGPWNKLEKMNYIDVVPPLSPILIPFWQKAWFQITVLSVSVMLFVVSLWAVTQVALRAKEQALLQGERARIARDIHDDIGMRMTQMVLQGELMQNELPPGSEMRSQLDQMCKDTRMTLSAMDEILWAINPRRDTMREFASYACGYAQSFAKTTSIQCILDVQPEISDTNLTLPLRRNMLLTVKEALNNVAKHSQATQMVLRIGFQKQALNVVIEDNGRGFDPAHANKDRNGLMNMKQRMRALGGDCHLASQPGKGCRVELIMPLVNRRHLLQLNWDGLASIFRNKMQNRPAPTGRYEVGNTRLL